MKKVLFLLLFFATRIVFAQSLNDYKYAIVPSKFEFLKEKDQYRLNTLTKLLMEKYGFVTYFDSDVLPNELADSNCNKVYVDVKSNSNLFVTKMTVVLKDCKNLVLFTSTDGKSREKELLVAYNQALREAFNSFDKLNYKYSSNVNSSVNNNGNDKSNIKSPNVNSNQTLFAKPLGANLFQLLTNDTDIPNLVLTIAKTNNPLIFIVEEAMRQGVVYKNNNEWIFDYYENEKLISEKLNIVNFN
ncbi:MAG: hypothetical protein K9I35_06955 [Flavobacterium sp.]|jgi:hypothetical protein|nr:hypothetical protein [Flavobacterium sp.]